MKIGDILTRDGQGYVVLCFDPEGVSPRLIYVEEIATGVRSACRLRTMARLGSPKGGGFASWMKPS